MPAYRTNITFRFSLWNDRVVFKVWVIIWYNRKRTALNNQFLQVTKYAREKSLNIENSAMEYIRR